MAKVKAPDSKYFTVAAEKYGGLSDDFRQGDPESYGWINLDQVTRGGACSALSATWLTFTRGGLDYFTWVKKPSGIKTMNNLFAKTMKAHDWNEPLKEYLRGYGMKLKKSWWCKPVNADSAAIRMVSTTGYKMVYISGDAGAHMMAALIEPNKSRYYDPNFGQVAFRSPVNLAYWFKDWWLNDSNYASGAALGRYIKIYEYV